VGTKKCNALTVKKIQWGKFSVKEQESEILSIKYMYPVPFFYNPHIFEFTISNGAYLYLYTLIVKICQ